MQCTRWALLGQFGLLVLCGLTTATVSAQFPGNNRSDSLPRLPDDQIEGSICTYKIKPREGKTIEGRFRVEGDGIFDVGAGVKLPPLGKPQDMIEKLHSGEGGQVKLPQPSRANRIGDMTSLKGGKIRIDFDHPDALTGMMVIWKKKKGETVYMGYFKEKQGNRFGAKQPVEVRLTED